MPAQQLRINVTSHKHFEQVYKICTDSHVTKILSKHIRLYTDVTCDKYFEKACEIRTDVTRIFNKQIRFILILMLGEKLRLLQIL